MRERAARVLVMPWSPLPTLKLQKQREFQLRPHEVQVEARSCQMWPLDFSQIQNSQARTVRDVMAIYLKTSEDVPDRLFNQRLQRTCSG